MTATLDDKLIWNTLAPRYDRALRWLSRPFSPIKAELARNLRHTDRALELAAGTGAFTPTLAQHVDHLTATDFSPEMLTLLRGKLGSEATGNVELAVEDATRLSFPDDSFDVVVCANALHIMPSPSLALAEMRRVLKPGGRLLVPTFAHGATLLSRTVSRLLEWLSPFHSHRRLTENSLQKLVSEAGFSITQSQTFFGVLPVVHLVAVSTTTSMG